MGVFALAADLLAPPVETPRWDTPGALAKAIDPRTVQTPALDLIDRAVVEAFSTPDARLILSIGPQEGKSQRVTKTGVLWALTRNPELRVGIASYAQSLAETFGREIRNWIVTNDGDEGTLDLGLRIARDNGAARRWTLDGHRGGVICVGVGSGLTGRPLDCVPGDTTIITPTGEMLVADLVKAPTLPLVLSWNHGKNRAEWRRIEATRTIHGRDLVEVRTASGRVVRCTPDHRIYSTGRGYVRAIDLRAGDGLLITNAGAGHVQRVRRDCREAAVCNSSTQARGAAVLLETVPACSQACDADVRGVRGIVRQAPLRGGEVGPPGTGPALLFEGVLAGGHVHSSRNSATLRGMRRDSSRGYRTVLLGRLSGRVLHGIRTLLALWTVIRPATVRVGEETAARDERLLLSSLHLGGDRGDAHQGDVPGLWGSHAAAMERPQVLQGRVSGEALSDEAQACGPSMRALREDVPAHGDSRHSLLQGLRKRRPLDTDDREGKLPLPDRDELCGLVSEDAATHPRTGRRGVHRLRRNPSTGEGRSQGDPGLPEFTGHPSRGRASGEQRCGEPSHPLQDLSHGAPQVEHDAVAMVRHLRGERRDVYDLQVEGNRNFFADKVLVHNCLIIDDPFADAEQAESQYYRDRVWDWWQAVGSTRLAPGAPVIVILTRWSEDDIAGRLVAAEDGHLWKVINIPALADHDPAKGQTDPLGREPGEWLQSARGRSVEQWEAIRVRSGARVFNALYQGRPSPETGNVWQRSWWRRYTERLWRIEDGTTYRAVGMDEVLMSWDMAFKDTKSSDYVVGQVWGRRGAEVFLLDQVHDRLTFTETVAAFQRLCAKWPDATTKLVEDKANGTAVIDQLRKKIPGIVPENPTDSKYGRAQSVAPFIEAGNVLLPSPEVALFDAEGLIDEAAGFPNAAHDDRVDATSQALRRMLLRTGNGDAWMEYLRKKRAAQAAEAVTTEPEGALVHA